MRVFGSQTWRSICFVLVFGEEGNQMDASRGIMSGTMDRFKMVLERKSSLKMCTLVASFVVSFLIIYYLISLGKTLDHYQTSVNEEIAAKSTDKPKDHLTECNGLWKGADLLKTISNLNVDLLTTDELALLERELAILLGQTRQRKTELMMEAIATLREKDPNCNGKKLDRGRN